MDIALHPNFAQNRLIYFTYSKPGADAWFGGKGAPKGCCGEGPADGNSHGSRLVFDRADLLYVTS